jgi:hypothetical protein
MVRRALVVLCLGLMTILLANCGQTYELQSLTVTATAASTGGTTSASAAANIEGIGNTATLAVTAHYSNSKTEDVTVNSIYQVDASTDPRAPLTDLTVSKSGIAKAVNPNGTCTWYAEPTSSANTAYSYGTQPYPVTVTYTENGVTATTMAYISVDSAATDCYDGITYTAPSGYPGTATDGW